MPGEYHVEHYVKDGDHHIYYSVYTGAYEQQGKKEDQVLEHKLFKIQTSHVTIHPMQHAQWSLGPKQSSEAAYKPLREAVDTQMKGYARVDAAGGLSAEVKRFLLAVRGSDRRKRDAAR